MESNQSNSKAIRAGALLIGLAFSAMGLLALLSIHGYLPSSNTLTFPAKVMATLGLFVFVFAGLGMMLFGFGLAGIAARTAGLSLLFFLLTFNWIAFGPGERNFTRETGSSFTGTSVSKVSQVEGRIAFGVVAGLMDLLLVYGFFRAKRHKT